ncbi:MAG: flavin reductase, partial [Eubacteriales bacterium]
FETVQPDRLKEAIFEKISKEWMLVTATKPDGTYNTMTASWGGLGFLWQRPVAFIFIRPQRYTYEFAEAGEHLSLSFFPPTYREALTFCGSQSGRQVDKAEACGLTPLQAQGCTYFEQASLVLLTRKLYATSILPADILDPDILRFYEKGDFHKMYICEVLEIGERRA